MEKTIEEKLTDALELVEATNKSLAESKELVARLENDKISMSNDLLTKQEAIEGYKKSIADKEKDMDELFRMNEELQKQLQASEKSNLEKALPTAEFDGVVYEFVKNVIRLDRKLITVDDVRANPSVLLAQLVKMGSGMIRVKA